MPRAMEGLALTLRWEETRHSQGEYVCQAGVWGCGIQQGRGWGCPRSLFCLRSHFWGKAQGHLFCAFPPLPCALGTRPSILLPKLRGCDVLVVPAPFPAEASATQNSTC